MKQTTAVKDMLEETTIDAFTIVGKMQRETNVAVICIFCETEQERAFSSLYQYYLGSRMRVPCVNKQCNEYRKHYSEMMSYDKFSQLMKHGCRLCGVEVRKPKTLCGACRGFVRSHGGELQAGRWIQHVTAHTEGFTLMWEQEKQDAK